MAIRSTRITCVYLLLRPATLKCDWPPPGRWCRTWPQEWVILRRSFWCNEL